MRHKVTMQTKTTTSSALGPTVTWTDGDSYWVDVRLIGALAHARYSAISSDWTHELTFRGEVSATLGGTRFKWTTNSDKILTPVQPAEDPDNTGRYTKIICKVSDVD